MTGFAPLAALRRSILGAWLAVAYALAVLAAALAPAPAMAHAGLAGALLCSGQAAPGSDQPDTPSEPWHCKGCLLNPVLGPPAPLDVTLPFRAAGPAASQPAQVRPAPIIAAFGLPQSRAPPTLS